MLQAGALLVSVLQNRTCALNKQLSQITVAALADAEKLLLASGGVFAGNQPDPGCELAALAECSTISDRGDERGGRERSDPRDRIQALAGLALLRGSLNQRLGLFDVAGQLFQFLLQFDQQEA